MREHTMIKNYTKKEAVSIAISAARLYRDNFVGNQLLFVATDKHKKILSLEVNFQASNYQHLTGLVATNKMWSRLDFYNFCIDGRLREDDIEIPDNGTTNQKLSIITQAFARQNLCASMMGNYKNSHPLLYTEKLVGGVKWALGFRDVSGKGDFVPDTLLEGDIRNNVYDTYRIIATYIKRMEEPKYEKLVYRAKNLRCDELIYPDDWGDRPWLDKQETSVHSA